jgi:hypothetical protein
MEVNMRDEIPLHIACKYSKSERVLLVLINLSLHAVKDTNFSGTRHFPLLNAINSQQE